MLLHLPLLNFSYEPYHKPFTYSDTIALNIQKLNSILTDTYKRAIVSFRMTRTANVYTDDGYIDVMKNCRATNKFEVRRLSSDHFFSVKLLEKAIVNRKVDSNKKKINWLKTHEILIEKSNPTVIKLRERFTDDFQTVSIVRKRGDVPSFGNIELEKLWPTGRPLTREKIKDLQELVQLVCNDYKSFYSFLDHVSGIEGPDDVEGFGNDVDFEIEFED